MHEIKKKKKSLPHCGYLVTVKLSAETMSDLSAVLP